MFYLDRIEAICRRNSAFKENAWWGIKARNF